MTIEEIFEDVRSLLREPQLNISANPWEYDNDDLIAQARAALRRLRIFGLTTIVLSKDGAFDTDPTEEVGLLISYYVANRLLSGDLIQKLQDGELGLVFRAGTDLIDTKTATTHFKAVADEYADEYRVLLTRALTPLDNLNSVFGEQEVPPT